jgi:peptidoglycan/LPS O-acetylase OafA/YrhL
MEREVGSSFGIGWAYITFFSAMAISIAAATTLWRLVEVPTMRFSKRIKLEARDEATAAVSTPQASLATT